MNEIPIRNGRRQLLRMIIPAAILLIVGVVLATRIEKKTDQYEADRIERTAEAVGIITANQDTLKGDLRLIITFVVEDTLVTPTVGRVEVEQNSVPVIVVR